MACGLVISRMPDLATGAAQNLPMQPLSGWLLRSGRGSPHACTGNQQASVDRAPHKASLRQYVPTVAVLVQFQDQSKHCTDEHSQESLAIVRRVD